MTPNQRCICGEPLWRKGLRYRVDRPPLRGMRRRADIVFGPAKVAVFVDGCFWHSCPEHATIPKTNRDWWIEKLEANVRRDRDTDRQLEGGRLARRSASGSTTTWTQPRTDRGVRATSDIPTTRDADQYLRASWMAPTSLLRR